jgi:hypothetical protein
MFVFVGDHGLHIGSFLQTRQGQAEYKLPALYITLPKWVLKKYPNIEEHMKENQGKLTTHWNLHHTMKHLMTYPNQPSELIPTNTYSLFDYIPNRSCHEAGIPSEFCLCNPWVPYNKSDPILTQDIQRNLDMKINDYVGGTSKCSEVSVSENGIKSIDMSISIVSERNMHSVPKYYFRVLMYVTRNVLLEMILNRNIPEEHLQNVDIRLDYLHGKRIPIFLPNSISVSLRRISAPTIEEKEEARRIGIGVDLCIVK